MVFDWDDHHAANDAMPWMRQLKEIRADFKATLFAVPGLGDDRFWDSHPDWIELVPHGWVHSLGECANWTYERMGEFAAVLPERFVHGWKSPYWQISDDTYRWLDDHSWWVADQHLEDGRRPQGLRTYFYEDGHWHGHVQNVCGNGLEETWDQVVELVRGAESFEFASEATVITSKPLVSVLTPSIPERAGMLEECKASVSAQTYGTVEHLVRTDEGRHYERRGCAVLMNELAKEAKGEWLLPLADDDLLLPGCISTLLSHSGNADIIYGPPILVGTSDTHFFGRPPSIPSFALIYADLWRELGGYWEDLRREEDRDLWNRALGLGAVFERVDEPLWIYRHHGGNKSYNHGVAA